MRFLRHIPIRQKLTIITMLASGLALLLACVAFATYEQMNFRSRMVRDLSIISEMIGANSAAGLTFTEASSVEQALNSLRAHPNIVRACVYDKGGRLFAKYQRVGAKGVSFPPSPQADGFRFGEQHLDLFRRISLAGETIGTIHIQSDLLEVRERIGRYAIIVSALLLAGSLVAFLLASRLQRIISQPLTALAATAATVATQKDYSVRAVKQSEDEIGSLIDGFNEMLTQIQQRDAALQSARDNLEKRVEERTKELLNEITERRRSEEERDRFFRVSLDMLCIVGLDGYFKRLNPAFEKLLGFTSEQLLARPFLEIIHPDDQRATAGQLQKLAEGKTVSNFENRCRRENGSYRWISWSATSVTEESLFYAYGRDITERKQAEEKLATAHTQLLEASRKAGMAEVATGVLHNVGNVLNSVNVSATLVTDVLKKSRVSSLAKVAALLRDQADAGKFFAEDPRAKELPGYLGRLADYLAGEQAAALTEVDSLRKNIDHIKDIVAMQQSYAQVSGITETVSLIDLVEDALRMNAAALVRHDIQVVREYADVRLVPTDKHKVLQILINLIRNAKYACEEARRHDKVLTVRVAEGDGVVRIEISDNGVGIPPENLTRIFAHGFTTRKDGHGFGLHSGALAAKEMHGTLRVHSQGPGQGATFTLELPLHLAKEIS